MKNDPWAESAVENNRCSHHGCNVPAVRIIGRYRGVGEGIIKRRGYTCGNHDDDKPENRERNKRQGFGVQHL